MKRILIITALLCISVFEIAAQNVSNVTSRKEGDKIYVSYTLDKEASVTLYVSEDGGKTFGNALRSVSGDVGEYVAAGSKTIVWDVLAERDNLQGTNIVFKVKAEPFMKMVYVEGGTFTMGCTGEQGSDCGGDERPAHQVTVSGFYIGKYEVTQAQWKAVMGSNPSYFKGDNLPVENVSWNDVQEFIQKLNAQTGKTYRLPTEAEWEYAARGGNKSKGYKYSGSNTLGNVAWCMDNSGSSTHAVGTKSPNEVGIYDMSGNVWEWCQDWYGIYSNSAQRNPTGPASGSGRVLRGGGWYDSARYCRVSYRSGITDGRYNGGGFRLSLVQN